MSAAYKGFRARIEAVEGLIKKRPMASQFDWTQVSTDVLKKIVHARRNGRLPELNKREYEHVMSARITEGPGK